LQLIVVAGNNKKLLKWLQKRKGRLIHKTLIYGFTDNIEELMSISDLIITKPGGITTAEALAMQLPMLIVEPLPGQEEYNTQHLLAIKAGIRIRDLKKVAGVVDALIVNKTVLKNLSIAAKNAAHPKAAEEIAKLIINI
jgi:processive 1,2-diacylglycerol beta-glucosyltransferase